MKPWQTGVFIIGCFLGVLILMGSGAIQSAYNLIQSAGSPLTRRTTLNFTGSGVSCADASPVTTCTIPGGSSVTSLPPYLEIGSTLYIPTDNMYQATLPSLGSWTALSTAPVITQATGTNGDIELSNTTTTGWLAAPTQVTSIEAVSGTLLTEGSNPVASVFFYDSTNSKVYVCGAFTTSTQIQQIIADIYTYSGTGTPSFSSHAQIKSLPLAGALHVKGAVAAGTLTCSLSINGGSSNSIAYYTVAVGTISKMGLAVAGYTDLFSVVVN